MDNIKFGSIFENCLTNQDIPTSCTRIVIVSDENVASLYAEQLIQQLSNANQQTHLITVPAGEASKTRETKASIENQMFELGCGRNTCIVALGGGVVTDLAGFVAATYCRGVPVIYIPTSLLAMVDASIGGKTAVNTEHGKNLIGTFTQPQAVLIDVDFLETLPDAEYFSAFAEIIKHALIADKTYFEFLKINVEKLIQKDKEMLRSVIQRSCEIKAKVVALDEKEQGVRAILNLGHTVAHALERCSAYQMTHGYAVGQGLLVESALAHQLGHLSDTAFNTIKEILISFRLLQDVSREYSTDALLAAMQYDKKSQGRALHFVLLKDIGACHNKLAQWTFPVPHDVLTPILQRFF